MHVIWNDVDGSKYAGGWDSEAGMTVTNEAIVSVYVMDGVSSLETGEGRKYGEIGVFQRCTMLRAVRLPGSLRKIGYHVFYFCKSLLAIDIPSGVSEFGERAFMYCQSLKTVTVPEGVVELPYEAFYGCKSLESVKLPRSLRKLAALVFFGCSSLDTINDDDLAGVTEIGKDAFLSCSSMTSFKFPPLLKTIEKGVFMNCRSLAKVELPPRLQSIGFRAFDQSAYGAHPDLCLDLPVTVRKIDFKAFWGCRVRFPTSISMLMHGREVMGLLNQVKEVSMSSRVNFRELANHLESLPERFYYDHTPLGEWLFDAGIPQSAHSGEIHQLLDDDMKFKVRGAGGRTT